MNQRTGQQRKSIEVYCRIMAELLNNAGIGQKLFYEKMIKEDIEWTQPAFKGFMKKVLNLQDPEKTSTTELSTTDMQALYETVDKAVSQVFGVRADWPSSEPPMLDEHGVEI